MCGLFAYIGKQDALHVCLKGLEQLEYRGYDSSGFAGVKENKIVFCKKAGKLSELKRCINISSMDLVIGHTRWATHGTVNDENAHPHFDAAKTTAIIHNGIIENYNSVKEELLAEGVLFASETDSEVVAHLIAKYYQGNLIAAFQASIQKLSGTFAIIAIHKNHPDEIVAVAYDCPLAIAIDTKKEEAILSSDPNALQGDNLRVIFLQSGEIAKIQRGHVDLFNAQLEKVKKEYVLIEKTFQSLSKEGHEHFMIKEIHEQPHTFQQAIRGRYDQTALFEELRPHLKEFYHANKIVFIGCGTSAHAGTIGSLFLEDLAKVPSFCEVASEARYRQSFMTQDTLVIAISQSGETADILSAVREVKKHGCRTLAFCNVKNSTLAREADQTILLRAGPEVSVCSTKAFTSQIASLFLFGLFMGQVKKTLSSDEIFRFCAALDKISNQIQSVLNNQKEIEKIAKKYTCFNNFFFMGRRYMFPTCLEAALKLKEISYVNANGYPAGELKHGPLALLDSNFPVVAFCANRATEVKIINNLMTVKARGAPILAIAPEHLQEIENNVDDVIWVPSTLDELAPFSSIVAGQLFAYFFAKERGCDIDRPRNLAKSVTVE